jgi:transcriptional regulator with XRE-family HTH domain
MAETRARPSEVFIARLREMRDVRGLSQAELARRMTAAGRPLGKLALMRIESGERGLSLDEALALAALLNVAPAHLLTPPDDGQMVWLTANLGVDGEEMRNFLRFGHPLSRTPERLSSELEELALATARALVDATHGNDQAGKQDALRALGLIVLAHRDAMEADDG